MAFLMENGKLKIILNTGKNTVQRHCEGDSPKQSKAPLIPPEGAGLLSSK